MRLFSSVLLVTLPLVASCSKKLSVDDCNALLGRGVVFAAYGANGEPLNELGLPGGGVVDVTVLRKTTRPDAKGAIDAFDKACVGSSDSNAVTLCGRRARNEAEFVACGGMAKKARETGEAAKLALPKKHNSDECSKYAEHAIKLGAATADDAGKLVRECDGWLEEGYYQCRINAKDAATWKACS